MDVDYVYTFSNSRSYDVLGYRPEELIGKLPTDFMMAEESKMARNALGETLSKRGPILCFKCRHLHREGHIVWVEANAMPIFDRDGVFKGYRGFARDITERRQAEEALRESEEKFRTLAETSAVAILVYQGDEYVYVNPAAERISGYSLEELLGMRFWDIIHPDEQERVREMGMARQQGKAVPTRYEVRFRSKDGRDGVLEINASRINFNGRPAGLITALDITKHKRSEMALNEAKAQAELYLDLMGHDINNMHQVALGYLELAEEMEENEIMKELLARPRDVLLRSARLIDNVRKLQKLRDGAYPSRPVEMVKMLSNVVKEYEAVPGKNLALDTQFIDYAYVEANELLYDVFSNLVSNAIKYSGSHARVTISLQQVQENGSHYYQVSVEDNGPGISDGFKEKVFNRLLRGDAGAKGMGLGLYIVKSLVDSYKGRVWVEDRISGDHRKGAKFVVLLPELSKN